MMICKGGNLTVTSIIVTADVAEIAVIIAVEVLLKIIVKFYLYNCWINLFYILNY